MGTAVEDFSTEFKAELDKLAVHIRIAEDWVAKKYESIEEFDEQVDDFMVEAGRMFDEWGLGQNRSLDVDTMINALSFVLTYRGYALRE